jgi:hypothetical protein
MYENQKYLDFAKPIENDDGSWSFFVIGSQITKGDQKIPQKIAEVIKNSDDNKEIKNAIIYLLKNKIIVSDRDLDIINPLGIRGLETSVVSYRHNTCGGLPVDTGAEIVQESIKIMPEKSSFFVKVKPEDELYFCTKGSLKKQSNGKLLDQIQQNKIKSVSLGFRYSNSDMIEIKLEGKTYYYHHIIYVGEVSVLDTIPSNLKSFIKTKNIMKKTKCLCGAKEGDYAVNLMTGEAVKLISQNLETETWKAQNFAGEEMEITGEEFEVLNSERLDILKNKPTDAETETETETDDKTTDSSPELESISEKTINPISEDENIDGEVKTDVETEEKEKACSCMNKLTTEEKEKELETNDDAVTLTQIFESQKDLVDLLNELLKRVETIETNINQTKSVDEVLQESTKNIQSIIADTLAETSVSKFKSQQTEPTRTFKNYRI